MNASKYAGRLALMFPSLPSPIQNVRSLIVLIVLLKARIERQREVAFLAVVAHSIDSHRIAALVFAFVVRGSDLLSRHHQSVIRADTVGSGLR
jgi:hypothetical protein